MKIIDKTPLVNEKGELGLQQRIQGMLQFGFNWPKELQVQKAITSFFDQNLEKGYTLIRNMPLGESGIVIPMILLGPTGIFVIAVSHLKGRYEAKGNTWNVESGNGYKPAPINLIERTQRMARALKAFIERQGGKLPVEIEPVLIAGDPGLHIESNRPAIRVMMIDGIKSFVNGLATGRPVMSAESVFEMSDRILNPRTPRKETPASSPSSVPEAESRTAWEQEPIQPEVSRARAIFSASDEARPFNPADFDFTELGGEPEIEIPSKPTPSIRESSPARPIRKNKPKAQRILGMTMTQLLILLALGLCLISIVIVGFVYVIPLAL